MIPELALWQELALVGLTMLSIVYVFYFRIWVALAMASDLLFAWALAVCVASIAVPPLFDAGARHAVELSPLPEALLHADAKVAALESLPADLIERALEKVGYSRDEADDPGAATTNESAEEVEQEPGPFESRVRPAVESLVSVLLRATSCMISFFLLLMALALRSSTATARELRALSARLDLVSEAAASS